MSSLTTAGILEFLRSRRSDICDVARELFMLSTEVHREHCRREEDDRKRFTGLKLAIHQGRRRPQLARFVLCFRFNALKPKLGFGIENYEMACSLWLLINSSSTEIVPKTTLVYALKTKWMLRIFKVFFKHFLGIFTFPNKKFVRQ